MPEQNRNVKQPKKSSGGISSTVLFLVYFVLGMVCISIFTYGAISFLSTDLPDHKQLESKIVKQTLNTFIYSSDGVLLRTLGEEGKKSFWAPYENLQQHTIDAFIAAEDSRLYNHWGVSLPDIVRAAYTNIKSIKIGPRKEFPFLFDLPKLQGGSTITQQLARSIFLDREKKFERKFKEMIVAANIEHTYSKSEILEFFLNRMDFGYPFIGIQAASRGYFGKDASELDIGESALFAGMLQGPTRYNPRRGEKGLARATKRRNIVLGMMVNTGKISAITAREEMEKPITLAFGTISDYGKAPYFVQYIEDELDKKYGAEVVDTEGFRVHTTLDYRLQLMAENALNMQLDNIQTNYADRLEYERPFGLTPIQAVEDSLKKTKVQGALVAVDVKTGAILAIIGGRGHYFFNRATDAARHAGSLFKPFVYTAALDNGWRCCDIIQDTPVTYKNPDGTYWEPQNFNEEYLGPMTLRNGFKMSQNIIAIKLMNDTENRGIGPRPVIQYARKMGITTPLNPVPSLAIGTSPIKLIEVVSAYTVFPNHGIKTEPFAVRSINDKNNTLIYRQLNGEGAKSEVLNANVSSLMLTMLETVAKEGTASNTLRRLEMYDRPCGGKTGTGNDYKDAWFVGFTPFIACGVWVGFDSEETTLGGNLYGTGASAALPIWIDFVKNASELLGYPKDGFTYEGITTLKLCSDSYKHPTANCPPDRIYTEFFLPGTEIKEYCDVHVVKRRGF
ncbi:penicillin-binding protein 1A [Candidatus Latescibacterota bacterium]